MKSALGLYCVCAFGLLSATGDVDKPSCRDKLFLQVQSGYAWMRKLHVEEATVDRGWDYAVEGYDADLSNGAFFDFAVGIRPWSFSDVSISYGVYQKICYEKYQTGYLPLTPGFTGATRMRFFEIYHKNIMLNVALHPDKEVFSWQVSRASIYPFVGAGIGIGFSKPPLHCNNKIGKFYTVAYQGNSSFGAGSTTSLQNNMFAVAFVWQAQLGLTCAALDDWLAFDIGYRFYDGGRFYTSYASVANTIDQQGRYFMGTGWKGRLKMHQLMFNIRFSF
jgi:hypothetical protein